MKIAIIGAGLSGLTLAYHSDAGADIYIFEKARGVGGRMATRYADPYEFDHGAQYFRCDHPDFQSFLDKMSTNKVVTQWDTDFYSRQGQDYTPFITDKPAYIATDKMNALCKYLYADVKDRVSLKLSCHIQKITPTVDPTGFRKWTLTDHHGQDFGPFDYIVATMPAPQMQTLYAPYLTPSDCDQFDQVKMQGCFSLMIGDADLKTVPGLPARISDSPIGWMAYNHKKPHRDTAQHAAPALIIQSTNEWAENHLEEDKNWVTTTLLKAASDILKTDLSTSDHIALHRWRYASVATPLGHAFWINEDLGLAACGDWCLGGKIEKAFLSGLKLAEHFQSKNQ